MHYCLARHTNTIGFSCNMTSICWHMFIFQICTNGFAAPNVSISTIVPTLHSTPFVSEITPNAYWHVKTLKTRFRHRNLKQKHSYSYSVHRKQRMVLLPAIPKHASEEDIITRRRFILVYPWRYWYVYEGLFNWMVVSYPIHQVVWFVNFLRSCSRQLDSNSQQTSAVSLQMLSVSPFVYERNGPRFIWCYNKNYTSLL